MVGFCRYTSIFPEAILDLYLSTLWGRPESKMRRGAWFCNCIGNYEMYSFKVTEFRKLQKFSNSNFFLFSISVCCLQAVDSTQEPRNVRELIILGIPSSRALLARSRTGTHLCLREKSVYVRAASSCRGAVAMRRNGTMIHKQKNVGSILLCDRADDFSPTVLHVSCQCATSSNNSQKSRTKNYVVRVESSDDGVRT